MKRRTQRRADRQGRRLEPAPPQLPAEVSRAQLLHLATHHTGPVAAAVRRALAQEAGR